MPPSYPAAIVLGLIAIAPSASAASAGTAVKVVPNLTSGSSGLDSHFVPLGDGIACNAYDPAHGYELWRLDTAGHATLIRDIRPGAASSVPTNLGSLGGQVLFSATDGATGTELWSSDGTAAGTALL